MLKSAGSAHTALVLAQVEVRAVGNAFQFLPVAGAKGKLVFHVHAGLGIVGQFVRVMVTKAQILRFDTQVRVPGEPFGFPLFVPVFVSTGFAEEFDLRLFEFARTEDKGLGRDFVAKALADLGNAEGDLDTRGIQDIAEVGKDALGRLRPEIEGHGVVHIGAHLRLEHELKRHGFGELADGRAGRTDFLGQIASFRGAVFVLKMVDARTRIALFTL